MMTEQQVVIIGGSEGIGLAVAEAARELGAEGNLNRREVAVLMGEVLGRTVQAFSVEPKGMPPKLTRMFGWYDKHSLLGNGLVLRAILGREPRTLRAYFEELNGECIEQQA